MDTEINASSNKSDRIVDSYRRLKKSAINPSPAKTQNALMLQSNEQKLYGNDELELNSCFEPLIKCKERMILIVNIVLFNAIKQY